MHQQLHRSVNTFYVIIVNTFYVIRERGYALGHCATVGGPVLNLTWLGHLLRWGKTTALPNRAGKESTSTNKYTPHCIKVNFLIFTVNIFGMTQRNLQGVEPQQVTGIMREVLMMMTNIKPSPKHFILLCLIEISVSQEINNSYAPPNIVHVRSRSQVGQMLTTQRK